MVIGQRIREIRESMSLSQGDVEARSGLMRCYVSRVENGYTVPSLANLEKLARAIGVPLYQFFFEGPRPPKSVELLLKKQNEWPVRKQDIAYFSRLSNCIKKLNHSERKLLAHAASLLARRASRKSE